MEAEQAADSLDGEGEDVWPLIVWQAVQESLWPRDVLAVLAALSWPALVLWVADGFADEPRAAGESSLA